MTAVEHKWHFEYTTDTPYLALICWKFGRQLRGRVITAPRCIYLDMPRYPSVSTRRLVGPVSVYRPSFQVYDFHNRCKAFIHSAVQSKMTARHKNPFRITSPLWRESNGLWCILLTKGYLSRPPMFSSMLSRINYWINGQITGASKHL